MSKSFKVSAPYNREHETGRWWRVTSVDGKANKPLIALLAEALGVPKSRVRILQGESESRKLVVVDGLEQANSVEILQTLMSR